MSEAALVVALAMTLDLVAGDPPNALHPVAWLGRIAGAIARRLPRLPPARAFVSGVLLVVFVVGLATASAHGADLVLRRLPYALRIVFGALLLKSCFALRGLLDAARALVVAHEREGLDAARARLSWLCSRDPSALDADELANGTIESLAENLSDSVVAPLFWFAVLGLPGAALYRAANTLDAMVGYRGEYEWLGKAAARFDDLLNLIPARLTAVCLFVGGVFTSGDLRRGLTVHRRDHGRTESPNAGHPMAMAAGLLRLRLDKPGVYVLGPDERAPRLDDVARAASLVLAAACVFTFAVVVGVSIRG